MKKLCVFAFSALLLSGCGSGGYGQQSSQSQQSSETGLSSSESKSTVAPTGGTLVAYFSVTNNTKKLASYAQEHLQCDIFEIVPKQEYTAADINYNSDCRANREQNDPSARPEIKVTISDISKYDNIILGYPIWWGQAPKILYTFIESYDFSNKKILPFCTSGSSPIGNSATNLAKSAPTATWLEGTRFSSSASRQEISSWIDAKLLNGARRN